MLIHLHALLCLLATTALAAKPNFFAGTYNLTSLTRTLRNGTVTTPIATNPYGRLILTPGLVYTVQFNTGYYASRPWTMSPVPFQPGTTAENNAIVTNSLANSGVYEVSANGQQVTRITRLGSNIPNFIGMSTGPPEQTFQLVQGQKLVERINWEDGSLYEFLWDRAEVL